MQLNSSTRITKNAERPWTKQQWLTFFFKIVRGLSHAVLVNEFLTPVSSKRLIKPRNPTDFKTTNIVIDHAKNNSQSYRVDPTKTAVCYSIFPKTTIDWNNLEQEKVSSKTVNNFKTQISSAPKTLSALPLSADAILKIGSCRHIALIVRIKIKIKKDLHCSRPKQ